MPQATITSSSALAIGIVRVIDEPSAPSARTNRSPRVSAPQMSSSVDSLTPVNSQHESMPCVYCTLGTAVLPHSIALFAPHSMKWMRETDGKRIRSSIVKTRASRTRPLIITRCCDGSTSHQP